MDNNDILIIYVFLVDSRYGGWAWMLDQYAYGWACWWWAIYRNPSLGLTTKARVCKGAGQEGSWESHFVLSGVQKNVREWTFTLPRSSHFGSWSPDELLNLYRAITGVKTHWIEVFFIALESSWNVNVWNGLAWPIWTPKTQVMAKRRVGSQIGNLTLDH